MKLFILAAILFTAVGVNTASAQTDEIQVYEGGLAEPGIFNLTLHTNYIADGLKDPAFPGAVTTADRSLNGVPEWALGVNRWMEVGLYLPVYSRDRRTGWGIDGFKPRLLVAVPGADERRFVYGVNFEFSVNRPRWDEKKYTSEVRPIIGWHLQSFDVFINPILDTSYDGLGNLDFAPSTKIAYKRSPRLALAVEEYSDYGPLKNLLPASAQSHQLFGVVDYALGHGIDLEAGVGFGLTDATDGTTFKLILARDLNAHHRAGKP